MFGNKYRAIKFNAIFSGIPDRGLANTQTRFGFYHVKRNVMKRMILGFAIVVLFLLTSSPSSALNIPPLKNAQGVDDNPTIGVSNGLIFRKYAPIKRPLEQYPSQQEPSPESEPERYVFGDPAGCSKPPPNLSPGDMLSNVQEQLGDSLILNERRITYIWNGSLGSFVETARDPFVYEFGVNMFQPPFTYKGDQAVTIFVQNGFAVWFRSYGGIFRLMAVPMVPGVEDTIWGEYVTDYWQKDSLPNDDRIVPVSKKLPCHWMIDEGYVSNETVQEMFDLDWHMPDYQTAGRKYLADTCAEANRISQEEIGWWDATSMCGPLTWQILHDANSFPYRIGSYDADARLFINANPRHWYGRPWNGFDPETFDLVVETDERMAGYDFETKGNLYTGDILFSYGSAGQYTTDDGRFSHIFMIAGIDENNSRLSITNMAKNLRGVKDCFIREVVLYTPGNLETGVINYEWDDHGYGFTGRHGFDVFRWKWITYHLEGRAREYSVRWGETLETIAFDWKVSPTSIAETNQLDANAPLEPGQILILPATESFGT